MNDPVLDPIHGSSGGLKEVNGDAHGPEPENPSLVELSGNVRIVSEGVSSKSRKSGKSSVSEVVVRRERPTRACTARAPKYVDPPVVERRPRQPKKVKFEKSVVEVGGEDDGGSEEENEYIGQCSSSGGVGSTRMVTSLVNVPLPEQMPRWRLRSMWELGSILHFLHLFRPLLNITAEFSAEELESSLLTPDGTLADVHIPLLKSIPPVTRMAYGRDTWIAVLCRKMRDWWHLVAEGELPLVSSQGAEIEVYKNLDPAVRVVILKAVCDIRVEQDDIRSYIDNSLKHGIQLSAFRKERIGGDSHGISYWYEDDEVIGHRLYRETRKVDKVEVKKGKTKGSQVLPSSRSYEWETVATNLDEFLDVSEKLFCSKNRTEVSLGKKLKIDMIPEIEKIHKRKEKWLKKQQREALLLDSFVNMDGFGPGRSLRDRKPVTYTFDDFDKSINEAIKVTKRKQPSPEHGLRREHTKFEPSANGRWNGSSHGSMHGSFSPLSPSDFDEMNEDHKSGPLDRSSRRRQKSQRYSGEEFVGELSDNDKYIGTDEDIVGEAVYYENKDDDDDDDHHKQKKKVTSSSEGEGDDEYLWSDENGEDEVEEDSLSGSEDSDQPRVRFKGPQGRPRRDTRLRSVEDSPSGSEDSDRPRLRFKGPQGRTRRGSRLRSIDDNDPGLRRSNRSTRNQINYKHYEISESETEPVKRRRTNPSETYSSESQDFDEDSEEEHLESRFDKSPVSDDGNEEEEEEEEEEEHQETRFDQAMPTDVKDETRPSTKSESPSQDEADRVEERRFLDLNELAPGSVFDDGPRALVKDDDEKDE